LKSVIARLSVYVCFNLEQNHVCSEAGATNPLGIAICYRSSAVPAAFRGVFCLPARCRLVRVSGSRGHRVVWLPRLRLQKQPGPPFEARNGDFAHARIRNDVRGRGNGAGERRLGQWRVDGNCVGLDLLIAELCAKFEGLEDK
jgi:hypothetical protein